jgi:hypothetical protein
LPGNRDCIEKYWEIPVFVKIKIKVVHVQYLPFAQETIGSAAVSCPAGGCCCYACHNSYFQQNAILNFIRARQISLVGKAIFLVAFTNLKEINRQLALENTRF